ncbi:MAG: hypothetical protein ABIP48_27690 [Planctomycetota bacterium]
MTRDKGGMVHHQDVEPEYLERRKLRKSAGWILLWALGVGAFVLRHLRGRQHPRRPHPDHGPLAR